MAPRDGEEFGDDLLAAKERDLTPLREESGDLLDLDPEGALAMESFLEAAWFSGGRAGHDQLKARVTEPEPDIKAVAAGRLESDFKALMEHSAEQLNLSLRETITMWGLLHQAWMAGNRSYENELAALYIEVNTDVAEEVRKWLEDQGDSPPPR